VDVPQKRIISSGRLKTAGCPRKERICVYGFANPVYWDGIESILRSSITGRSDKGEIRKMGEREQHFLVSTMALKRVRLDPHQGRKAGMSVREKEKKTGKKKRNIRGY